MMFATRLDTSQRALFWTSKVDQLEFTYHYFLWIGFVYWFYCYAKNNVRPATGVIQCMRGYYSILDPSLIQIFHLKFILTLKHV